MRAVPQSATEPAPALDREQMADVVRRILAQANPPLKPDSIAFSASPYASRHILIDTAVSVDGSLLQLVLKDVTEQARSGGAAHPDTPRLDGLEADIYTVRLAGMKGPPHCYGALRDGTHQWLLLERVRGRELTKVGDLDIWRAAARWLGRLHSLDTAGFEGGLVRDEAYMWRALRQAGPGIEAAPVALGLRRVASAWDAIVAALLAIPVSAVHGDAFPANVIVGHDGRICFLDWELAGLGPGLVDLAAMTAGTWTAAERQGMVAAYAAGVTPSRPVAPSDLTRGFIASRILVAVEMLGAPSEWEPPSHQVWDWAGELSKLADEFGL